MKCEVIPFNIKASFSRSKISEFHFANFKSMPLNNLNVKLRNTNDSLPFIKITE